MCTVAGMRALKNVQHSLTVADRVTTLWMERYLPKDEVARKAYLQKMEALRIAAKRPAFSKEAWVRPSAAPLQQKENTMTKTSAVALLGAATLMLGGGDATAFSEPAQIYFSPQRNRLWSTLFTNEVPLRWSWPQDASRASLEISGMQGSFVTNFTSATTDCLWKVFDGQTPAREESYHLALTFYNASDVAINGLTSRLALVKGAFGPVPVDPGPSDSQWGKVKENALLPYDADWTAATSGSLQSQLVIAKGGGQAQTNLLPDASGYFGWKLVSSAWGYGTFALELSFPGTVTETWDAALERLPLGTMIRIF